MVDDQRARDPLPTHDSNLAETRDHMTARAHPPVDARDNSLAGARAWFSQKGLSRPRQGRILAGVSAGLARRYDVNPLVMRVVTIAAVVALSPLVYIAAWILMPQDQEEAQAP
jgi:phage shock protein PspC (stress-responsive transcriptional regulator)